MLWLILVVGYHLLLMGWMEVFRVGKESRFSVFKATSISSCWNLFSLLLKRRMSLARKHFFFRRV